MPFELVGITRKFSIKMDRPHTCKLLNENHMDFILHCCFMNIIIECAIQLTISVSREACSPSKCDLLTIHILQKVLQHNNETYSCFDMGTCEF